MVERGGGEKSLVSVVGRVIITKKLKKKAEAWYRSTLSEMENWCDCGKKVRGANYKKQRMGMTRRLNSEGARR